jgi:hypothetical protein
MTTRRQFLASVPIIAIPQEARPEKPQIDAESLAKELSQCLARMHGGDWRISIDRHHEFVLISKKT